MTAAAVERGGRKKNEKRKRKRGKKKGNVARRVGVRRGKFMALHAFRDSSRLQLLVFDVYGSWNVIDGTPGTIPPTDLSTSREAQGNEIGIAHV